jgi:hypothetical protein
MPDKLPHIPADSDDEGLSSLSDLAAEVVGLDPLDFEPTDTQQRLKRTTSSAERYPPLLDHYQDQQAQEHQQPHDEPPRRASSWGYNLLSFLFMIGSLALIVYFVHIWNNPYSPLNPLAPPTPYIQITTTPVSIVQAPILETETVTFTPEPTITATIAPTVTQAPTEAMLVMPTDDNTTEPATLEPPLTIEPLATLELSATSTSEPTNTVTLSVTAIPTDEPSYTPEPTATDLAILTHTSEPTATLPPTITHTPSPTHHPDHRFQLSETGVTYRQNDNNLACNWQSITGKVSDQRGNPLNNYRIRIIDVQDPTRFDVSVTTGAFINLGDGVYEQLLGNTPRDREYRVQVYDTIGLAVSAPITLSTRAHCSENVTVVDFVQFR